MRHLEEPIQIDPRTHTFIIREIGDGFTSNFLFQWIFVRAGFVLTKKYIELLHKIILTNSFFFCDNMPQKSHSVN